MNELQRPFRSPLRSIVPIAAAAAALLMTGCDELRAGGSMTDGRDVSGSLQAAHAQGGSLIQTPREFEEGSMDSPGEPPEAAHGTGAEGHAVDSGALRLVDRIRAAIGDDEFGARSLVISMRGLRNQSRAAPDEVDLLASRLIALLGPAGEVRRVRFLQQPSQETEYTLGGAVYLIERDGREYWEIYFALRPAGANWRIWKNAEPVRLEREKQMAGSDSILFAGEPRRPRP